MSLVSSLVTFLSFDIVIGEIDSKIITEQLQDKFADAKEVIRCLNSKDTQYNGRKKKDKITNNDLQNIAQKSKDRAIQFGLQNMIP